MNKKGKNTKIGAPVAKVAAGNSPKKVVFKVDKDDIVKDDKKKNK